MFQWLFKDSSDIVILDKKGIVGDISGERSIDIILTPSFYWFVEKNFSVKFTFQIKEYLPSIFEEFTDTKYLSYQIVPKGDGVFWLFAYDNRVILQALLDNGIDLLRVSKIYFAQNSFFYTKAVDLENGFLLCNLNGVISRVPNDFTKDVIKFNEISKEELSLENGAILKRYTNFIDENLIKKILLPLLFLVVVEGAEGILLWLRNKKLLAQKDTIFQSYNLPPTSFQNRAILSRLKSEINSQKNIRKFIGVLFNTPFNKDDFIKDIELTEHRATITIKLKNRNHADRYKVFLSKNIKFAKISKATLKENILSLEFKL